jgi:hypothetical protein
MRRILVLTEWFFPANKAPEFVKSCNDLINNLSQEYSFFILTSDRDKGGEALKDIVTDKWIAQTNTRINKNFVRYVSKKNMTTDEIAKIIKKINPHVIYINTMLSLRYSLLPFNVINKIGFTGRIIISPREALTQNGIGYNALKRKFFSFLLSRSHFRSNVVFHASDEGDVAVIRKCFGRKILTCTVENFSNCKPADVCPQIKQKYGELFG